MCNANAIDWFRRNLKDDQVRGRRVLEVGSRNVNGSIRPVFEAMHPAEYIGIDMEAGPGVDIVCDVTEAEAYFGAASFDVIACISTLEHVENLHRAVLNMQGLCQGGGLIALSVPDRWKRHNYPGDYWRFTEAGLVRLFGQCRCLLAETVEERAGKSTVFALFEPPQVLRYESAIMKLTG